MSSEHPDLEENDLNQPLTEPSKPLLVNQATLEINMLDEESESESDSQSQENPATPPIEDNEIIVSQVPKGLPSKRGGIFVNNTISQLAPESMNQLPDDEDSESKSMNSSEIFTSDDEISEAELGDTMDLDNDDGEGDALKDLENGELKKKDLLLTVNFNIFSNSHNFRETRRRKSSKKEGKQ